jgi:hypothetical protein
MTPSAHQRYRRRLEALAAGDPFGLGMRRRSGRFFPDQEPFAVLTYEAPGRMCRVEVFSDRHEITDAADEFPGLPRALAAGAEIVRYHPRRRCTVRLGERFGKVAPEAAAIFAAHAEVWRHRGELGFAVPEPLELDGDIVWLARVAGGPPPPEQAERMGAALATLHRSRVRPARRHEPREAAAELIRRVPALRREVEALGEPIVPGPPRPLHGAPHPPQWLADEDRLGLIDFDGLALGDPEADVAAFMEGADEGAEAFRAGYGPLDERRLRG